MTKLTHTLAAVAVASVTVALSVGTATAAPQAQLRGPAPHCAVPDGSTKVVLDDLEQTTTVSGLSAGDSICYKAGKAIAYATVDEHGQFDSTITNKHGSPLDISYYVVTPAPVEENVGDN